MTEVALAEPEVLKVAIVYNPFKATDIERHDLVFREGATLADYVGDLGDEAAWSVGYRGEAYEKEQWGEIIPEAGEGISLVRIPEGGGSGGGGKSILRMIAMIAIAVVAFYFVGPWAAGLFNLTAGTAAYGMVAGLAAGTFAMAGMLLVNAILPPAEIPKSKGDGASYGVDGPKNTAREGVVVPIVFGKYRIGGNIVDLYTKNVGDDQYLFMRVVLNDGKVKSVGEFEINDQPISNFTNVETRVQLGTEEGEANDWFGEAVRMVNRGVKLTTAWSMHTTNGEVDRVRIDLLYPQGLAYYKDDGRVLAAESDIAFEYRPYGSGSWLPLTAGQERNFMRYEGGTNPLPGVGTKPPTTGLIGLAIWGSMVKQAQAEAQAEMEEAVGYVNPVTPVMATNPTTAASEAAIMATSPVGASRLTLTALATLKAASTDAAYADYDMTICYRRVGTSAWTVAGREQGRVERSKAGNEWSQFPMVYRTRTVQVDPTFAYEVLAFGGSITNGTAYMASGDGIIRMLKAKEGTFRYSYESGILPRGRYDIRVRRLRPIEDNKKRVDEVFLQDVAEIDVDNIHYVGTANVSLKIKLDDQLSGVPKFTSMVEGSIVKLFDEEGNIESEQWSPWPCWQVLDIFLNQDRGRGIKTSRIDFAAFKEWEQHCIDNNLQFNGVFDADSNVWDATQVICRVGHAQLLRIGTKYSVVIDRASDPVMLFNDSNIIEGTFTTTWLPMADRANEIQYTFYPEEDGFEERMIRVVDPDALNTGAGLKVAQITEKGVTSYAQAQFNIEKQLRENKLLGKSISFDAPIEAIGLSIGDVAAVQHTSANYGRGIGTGRLKAGTTLTKLKLDCPVSMDAGVAYKAMLIQSKVKRYDAVIQSITGKHVYVSGLPAGEMARCTRLVQGDKDIRIVNIHDGSPHDRIVVDDPAGLVAGPVELFDTDVIEERDVSKALNTSVQNVEEVTLTAPLLTEPQDHAIWFVGPVQTVKKLYRLRGIDGDDIHRRTLSFVEYDPQVYLPLGAVVTRPDPQPSAIPPHVKRLSISYPPVVDGAQTRVKATVKWDAEDPYYQGADVYYSLDGKDWDFYQTLQNVTSFDIELMLGADVQFRVVAIGKYGRRAPGLTAPVCGATIVIEPEELAPPTALIAATSYFRVDAAVTVSWTRSISALARDYRVQWTTITQDDFENSSFDVSIIGEDEWNDAGTTQVTQLDVPRQDVGYYVFRVRSEYGRSVSSWATKKFDLSAPALPNRVTGLRLNNGVADALTDTFNGKDARFEWRDVATEAALLASSGADVSAMDWHWKDYEVTIKSMTGEVLRRQTTRDPFFTYTYERNVEDTLASGSVGQRARRAFQIEVRLRGRQEQVSEPAIMSVSNPAPALQVATIKGGIDQIGFTFPENADPDYLGVIVWTSLTPGFTPGPGTQRWMSQGNPSFFAAPLTKHYVRYAIYDVFGTDELNISPEYEIETTGLTDEMISPGAREGFTLSQEILDRIDLVDGDGEGSVNARLASETVERQQAITAEAQARTSAIADEAAARAAALQAQSTALGGQIVTVNTRVTTVSDNLQQQINMLSAASGDGYAGLVEERNQRVEADEAFSAELVTVYSRLDDADAAVISERNARVTATDAITNSLNAQIGRIDGAYTAITQEQTTRADAILAVNNSINTLTSRMGSVESAITNEATTRAEAIEALTLTVSQQTSQIGAANAAITSEATTRSTAINALSGRIDVLQAEVDAAEASVVAEVNARATAVQAVTNALNAQISRIDAAAAAILAETNTRADQYVAVTGRLNTMESVVGTSPTTGLRARIQSAENTLVDLPNQYASASSFNSYATTVNGHTSTINSHTQSINGLYSSWGVHLNNNGVISGVSLTSQILAGQSAPTSAFKVQADQVIFTNSAGQGNATFEMVGGVAYLKEAAIRSVNVGVLTAGNMNAAMNIGSAGKIVLDGTNNRIVIYD